MCCWSWDSAHSVSAPLDASRFDSTHRGHRGRSEAGVGRRSRPLPARFLACQLCTGAPPSGPGRWQLRPSAAGPSLWPFPHTQQQSQQPSPQSFQPWPCCCPLQEVPVLQPLPQASRSDDTHFFPLFLQPLGTEAASCTYYSSLISGSALCIWSSPIPV